MLCKKLRGECVLINSDNTTAVSCIAKKGSSSDRFKDEVTRKIYKIGEKFCFEIKICHLAGVLNSAANDASRRLRRHNTEWALSEDTMTIIKHSCKFQMNIDLFASHHNK